jgi:hypothetical protein
MALARSSHDGAAAQCRDTVFNLNPEAFGL